MPKLPRFHLFASVCLIVVLTPVVNTFARQTERSVTFVDAPVRLYPDLNRTPLATLPPGTPVQIMEKQGEWLRISFRDSSLGDRVGFVRAEHIKPLAKDQHPAAVPQEPQSIATSPAPAVDKTAPRNETHAAAAEPMPAAAPAAPDNARTASNTVVREPHQFTDAQLTMPEGDKTKQVDVTISYAGEAFQLLEKGTRKPMKVFAYKSFTGGEYSYSKSPRWKSGVFLSPFLFLSSGKKHWLLVKTADDYAMLRLDKNNYKLIMAEWETRTGLKIEAEGENK